MRPGFESLAGADQLGGVERLGEKGRGSARLAGAGRNRGRGSEAKGRRRNTRRRLLVERAARAARGGRRQVGDVLVPAGEAQVDLVAAQFPELLVTAAAAPIGGVHLDSPWWGPGGRALRRSLCGVGRPVDVHWTTSRRPVRRLEIGRSRLSPKSENECEANPGLGPDFVHREITVLHRTN